MSTLLSRAVLLALLAPALATRASAAGFRGEEAPPDPFNRGGTLKQTEAGVIGPLFTSMEVPGGADDGPAPKPVAHWTFDEIRGDKIPDSSGNGHHGTLVDLGSNPLAEGKMGKALKFNGQGYVRIEGSATNAALNLNGKSFTISLWTDDAPSRGYMIAQGRGAAQGWGITEGYFCCGDSRGRPTIIQSYFYPSLGLVDDDPVFKSGPWRHLAVTYDAEKTLFTTYLDGARVRFGGHNRTVMSDIHCPGQDVLLGARAHGIAPSYAGRLDDVRFFDRALTEEQVKAVYEGKPLPATGSGKKTIRRAGGVPPKPAAHWTFDAIQGGRILDSSGNGHHGTLVNLGADALSDGRRGKALKFDGRGYVRIEGSATNPALSLNGKSFTIAVWTDDAASGGYMIAQGRGAAQGWGITEGFFCCADSRGSPTIIQSYFYATLDLLDKDLTLKSGPWRHLAVTYDAETTLFETYVDGKYLRLAGRNRTNMSDIHCEGKEVLLGARAEGIGPFYAGRLDDMRLYDKALTSEQIEAVYEDKR